MAATPNGFGRPCEGACPMLPWIDTVCVGPFAGPYATAGMNRPRMPSMASLDGTRCPALEAQRSLGSAPGDATAGMDG